MGMVIHGKLVAIQERDPRADDECRHYVRAKFQTASSYVVVRRFRLSAGFKLHSDTQADGTFVLASLFGVTELMTVRLGVTPSTVTETTLLASLELRLDFVIPSPMYAG